MASFGSPIFVLLALLLLALQCGSFSMHSKTCRFAIRTPGLRLSNVDEEQTAPSEKQSSNDNAASDTQQIIADPAKAPPVVQAMTSSDIMAAMGTSPRRIAVSMLFASGIALVGNLFGVTSRLLTAIPEDTVEQSGLDTYFPRGSYKRFKNNLYTFVVPKEWVADTALELAKAQRRAASLDYSMRQTAGGTSRLPDAAFGPPGNSLMGNKRGDTNVSVLISSTSASFGSVREMLGSPEEAARKYIENIINASGTRKGTLISAREDASRDQLYELEYVIDRGERGPPLQAISIIAVLKQAYLTLTVVAPLSDWQGDNEAKLRKISSGFHLL